MDDIQITLPCGFIIKYSDLKLRSSGHKCFICNNHVLNINECLEMPVNQYNIKQRAYDIETKTYQILKSELEVYQQNPDFYLNESIKKVKGELDLKREELKAQLIKQIDNYYFELSKKIDEDYLNRKLKFLHYVHNIQIMHKKRLSHVDTNTTFDTKLKTLNENLTEIKEEIEFIKNTILELDSKDMFISKEFDLNMKDIFGEVKPIQTLEPIKYNIWKTFEDHHSAIADIRFYQNDKILTGSHDHTIKLWDTNTNECIKTFTGHTGNVWCLCIINNEYFLSGSGDSTIKTWNSNSGECVKTLSGHSGAISSLKLLHNGNLISGSWDFSIKEWSYQLATCVNNYIGHEGYVDCLEETFDGKIISGSGDRTIRLWSQNGICLKVLFGHHDGVICLKLLPKNLVASGSYDKTIKIWDLEADDFLKSFESHTGPVLCLKQIKAHQLISSSEDGSIKIWNIDTGECIKNILDEKEGLVIIDVNINGDIISGNINGKIKFWKQI
ncbi:unnamed protein product [Brachionus calyciflorus]|uniref:Uncharacterized protein n=1 Tax=Brachionus calyciflorus TaxID=104777 RepID=A0A814LXN7_9BILA|nr:unnamed protein product [Brachionus calyciflorus]